MSIFLMNHVNMEHSQVTHSTSMEEELIHPYVSLYLIHSNYIYFLSIQLVYESPEGVPGMNVYFYASYSTHYYGFKMTWSTF